MWSNTVVAGAVFLITLSIQGTVAIGLLRGTRKLACLVMPKHPLWGAVLLLELTLLSLLISALMQMAVWAGAFMLSGEFAEYEVAFYHSAVNFTTLGYGDIVMSERWRLLGPLETINGILMLGLSASMLYETFRRIGQAMSGPI